MQNRTHTQTQKQEPVETDFGDFEEITEEQNASSSVNPNQTSHNAQQQIPERIRLPRNKEVIGIILERLGGNRMKVKGTDGKLRNCRVPGKYKRKLWLRPKDIILIVPWELDDSKADIIYKYPPTAINQLKKKGFLNNLEEGF